MPEKFEGHSPQAKIEKLEEKLEREKLELRLETLLKEAVENRLIDPVSDREVMKRLAVIKKNGRENLNGLRSNVVGFEVEIKTAYTLAKSVEKLRSWGVTIAMGNELREKVWTLSFDERVAISMELKDFANDLDTLRSLVEGPGKTEQAAIFTAIGATPAKNFWGFELLFDNVQNPMVEDIREKGHKLAAVLTYREMVKVSQ